MVFALSTQVVGRQLAKLAVHEGKKRFQGLVVALAPPLEKIRDVGHPATIQARL
jgi:hypothetical protein